MRDWTALGDIVLQEKEDENDEKHIGMLIRKKAEIKGTY